jgi:hypothetical protein
MLGVNLDIYRSIIYTPRMTLYQSKNHKEE